jgi:leader peptidase (prepilin peptidase)/N-methyltransferase
MQYAFWIIIFLFGSALGSFIAVISNRYNTGLSFLKGRSVCFSCNTELKNKDLVPVFSFLFLRGKCRYCQSKIPKETLIIEILMGILAILAVYKVGLTLEFLILILIFGNILLISIYDLKHFIIPDSFLVSLFILSFFYLSLFPYFHFSLLLATCYLLLTSLFSGVILAIPFLLIFLISKGTWFGLGDVKYILVLGFFLGFSMGLSAIVLSFWIGATFALLAISFKKITPHINLPLFKNNLTIKSEIPFGPFLSLGIIISFCLNLDLFKIHELFF